MTVFCYNNECKYHSENNFCQKKVVGLNKYGACFCYWNNNGDFRGKGLFLYDEENVDKNQVKIEEYKNTIEEDIKSNDGE